MRVLVVYFSLLFPISAFCQFDIYRPLEEHLCRSKPLKIRKVYNLGDSLTDTGNFQRYSSYLTGIDKNIDPKIEALYPGIVKWLPADIFLFGGLSSLPKKPYWKGRFSNGPVSSEIMAESIHLNSTSRQEFVNFAHGGSTTIGYGLYLWSFLTSWWSDVPELATWLNLYHSLLNAKWMQVNLVRQTEVLLQQHQRFNDDEVVIMSGGANDYLNEYWDPEFLVTTQYHLIKQLLDAGVKILVWGTLPDVTETPCLKLSPNKKYLKKAIYRHNQLAAFYYLKLKKEYSDRLVLFMDNASIFQYLLKEARDRGMVLEKGCVPISFTGCYDREVVDIRYSSDVKKCEYPSDFFFWDSAHLGDRANLWVGALGCQLMTYLNFDTRCPVVEGFNPEALLIRYFNESQDPGVRILKRALLTGKCPSAD
ncbi:MAG: SGNH/GDSL hydrolase family protein [Endozoicomonas sp.]|uniref:SGNH/GDSL hydrolase family protein n=1 Tax=Endozoicomonas sp. TaxID=1892382 RepID=UPI003D9B9AE7